MHTSVRTQHVRVPGLPMHQRLLMRLLMLLLTLTFVVFLAFISTRIFSTVGGKLLTRARREEGAEMPAVSLSHLAERLSCGIILSSAQPFAAGLPECSREYPRKMVF